MLLGAGALLSLVLGVFVYSALSADSIGAPVRTVVVARQEVPAYTQFTASNMDQLLTTRNFLVDNVPRETLTQPVQAVARITTVRLLPGEVVMNTPDRLATSEGGSRASAAIPEDKVAFTIPANDTLTVAGALNPGDRVNIIATWAPQGEPAVTRVLYQDVRVFAVGPWQPAGDPEADTDSGSAPPRASATSITFLLDYSQAAELQYLLQTGGSIALALRRLDQHAEVTAAPITADYMRARLYGTSAATTGR
jgi:pilus assembly protein CpaB